MEIKIMRGMTKQQAIDILEEVKMLDDSMYQYNDAYMEALDYVLDLVKNIKDEFKISTHYIDRNSLYEKSERLVKECEDEIEDAKIHPENYTDNFIVGMYDQIAGMAHIQQLILEEPLVIPKDNIYWKFP